MLHCGETYRTLTVFFFHPFYFSQNTRLMYHRKLEKVKGEHQSQSTV